VDSKREQREEGREYEAEIASSRKVAREEACIELSVISR
jgi:hypothetical protein